MSRPVYTDLDMDTHDIVDVAIVEGRNSSGGARVRLRNTGASDPEDYTEILQASNDDLIIRFWDDSAAAFTERVRVTTEGYIEFPSTVRVISGSGSPEGAVSAVVGSLFLRSNGGAGTTLYVKESGTGNTGWAAK